MKEKKKNLIYILTISLLSALLVLFIVLYSLSASSGLAITNRLEYIYDKNFYDLVDNINNTEIKLAKVINADNQALQAKLLFEISQNSKMASNNLDNLPYSIENLSNSVGFVNQISGYTETLAKNLQNGSKLSASDNTTLENIYDSVLTMKNNLSKMNQKMWNGYSVVSASKSIDGKNNNFSIDLSKIKQSDIDYPTMIYDGPFSDSVVNKKIVADLGKAISIEEASKILSKIFTNYEENSFKYISSTQGRFETYNFIAQKDGKEVIYAQITQKGGHLLTATSYADVKKINISIENAKKIAHNFAKKNDIENPEVVWYAQVNDNAYINIAPKNNGVILYPDLVKIKIDLGSGDILGYEATNYYTNHTTRELGTINISETIAKNKVPKKFSIKFSRLALIPLEYNQEILTYEVSAKLGNDEYYFYFDSETGQEVNILKVIQTSNGNLLM